MESASPLDDLMNAWEENVRRVSSGTPRSHAFLDLAAYDMKSAANNIDCPYCRRHMLLEAEEIVRVLDRLRSDGNGTLLNSFQIVANVLLGGLRRAGIIS